MFALCHWYCKPNIFKGKENTGSDVERDVTRIACLPPAKLSLPVNSPVIQISCGLHHSLLLMQNGQVYSFGSNQYGQLGCGDILVKSSIQLVKLPCSAVHIAAGSNHSVVLTSKGEVYTFGCDEVTKHTVFNGFVFNCLFRKGS